MTRQQAIKATFSLSLILSSLGLTLFTTTLQANAQPLVVGQVPAAQSPAAQSAAAYARAMQIGYAATGQGDYQTALINFRRALVARPGDRYATAAIANVESYIAQIRAIEERNRRVEESQAMIDEAVAAQDWVCAAASVDTLITLVPADSIERGRLVAYRGELAGLLRARASLENWSTVCDANIDVNPS
ncbi:MAG: hypothetical protein HC886_06510 [Leptolyngbyaceae cyanobacterium SM1_1_3]|nr:hypothetical protein [Leptolyngbyaceae cyanobacterium SM1_1_3]NJN01663.1 hypothetical protein [Leptolyngbyaceae cyanobacterium RM1_1_2]NJO11589.1 hypothetical protein [Leptolyngbyaceae cyanobacterium SL_1_1]